MKIGELLVSAGKLTPAQVEETLKGQAIFGGRFGTNLVEMGFLDEHDLAHFLSKKTGVPHAAPEQLMDIPPQVLRIIPEHVVRKYRVVPVAVNNRKLILAMADPSDFSVIDEISFQTGYIIVPVVVPEIRLISAMEKHYNIKRELRYIKVEGMGRRRAAGAVDPPQPTRQAQPAAPTAQGATARPAQAAAPALDLEEEVIELPLLAELESLGDLAELTPQMLQPVAPAARAQEPARKQISLEGVLQGFTEARDRHSVAEMIVKYTAQQFKRCAMFLLKGGKATGWVAQIGTAPVADFEKIEIDLNEPSILKVVAESRTFYLGPMPITPGNTRLVAALGGGNPINNLLLPLMMMGRVVAILYVEGEPLRLEERIPELQKLLGKGSMALEILILKNKILS